MKSTYSFYFGPPFCIRTENWADKSSLTLRLRPADCSRKKSSSYPKV